MGGIMDLELINLFNTKVNMVLENLLLKLQKNIPEKDVKLYTFTFGHVVTIQQYAGNYKPSNHAISFLMEEISSIRMYSWKMDSVDSIVISIELGNHNYKIFFDKRLEGSNDACNALFLILNMFFRYYTEDDEQGIRDFIEYENPLFHL
jgi:hypothetical protein